MTASDADLAGADYSAVSFWFDDLPVPVTPRAPLEGDLECDVAVIGAGYTGLWTAYYLAKADPTARIVVLEREVAGFGASGRNGGWCSALFAASKEKIAREAGRDAAIAMQRAMFDTVDEVGRVAESEVIDARFHKGGTLAFATAPVHVERLKAEVESERSWGFGEEDVRWLDARAANARIATTGCLGAVYTPHCARVQPARLARGLADIVESLGVTIYERSPVTSFEPHVVNLDRGTVRAGTVVRAVEGYTAELPRHKRELMPLYSLMIATEPLPGSFWDEVGWSDMETFTDGRHLLIYAQRTADDRIALGGRGAPYHFGSRVDPSFDREPAVFDELQRVLATLWPAAREATVTHRWGGPLAVPRDWYSSVGFDRASGIAWAGGYVGDGVSTTNLAGRTLRDLILGEDTELTRLPWVQHRSRRWEPEPLRWLGTNLSLRLMASADRAEARTGRPSKRAKLIGRLTGH
ncbi:MAG TPA: FAD-binding oxidoreductase [Actinomycetota bacterium]|nr:FAD-binding oxidoreductase [Actinomycetota bacterium]